MFKIKTDKPNERFDRMFGESSDLAKKLITTCAEYHKLNKTDKLKFTHDECQQVIVALAMAYVGAGVNAEVPPDMLVALFGKFLEMAYKDEVKISCGTVSANDPGFDSRITHTMDGKPIVGHC